MSKRSGGVQGVRTVPVQFLLLRNLEPVPTSAPVLLSSPRSTLCKLRKENYAQVRTGKYARVHEAVTSTRRLCHLTRPLGTSLLPQVPCWN